MSFNHVPDEVVQTPEDNYQKDKVRSSFIRNTRWKLLSIYYNSLITRNKKGLFEWRKRVGDDVANYVARKEEQLVELMFIICVKII